MSKKDNKTTEQFDYNGMPRNQRPRKFSFAWVWLLLGLFLIGYNFFFYKGESQETDWKAFKEMLADGDVEKMILVNKEYVEIYIKPDKISKYKQSGERSTIFKNTPMFTYNIGSIEKFESDVVTVQEEAGISEDDMVYISNETRRNWGGEILYFIFPLLLLVLLTLFMFRGVGRSGGSVGGMGGQIFNIGKSQAQLFDKNTSSITFKDVAGLEEAKVEIMEVVDFLKNHPDVERVNHPSLATGKARELYDHYFPNGAASIFTFEIKGGADKAKKFTESLNLFSLLANVADVKSLVIHPASTTHSQMTEDELLVSGITPSTVRLSIGTEHIDDIIEDLKQGFEVIK